MKQFFESVRINNGEAFLIELHQRRFDLTRLAHFGILPAVDLGHAIESFVAAQTDKARIGLQKLRLTYSSQIEKMEVEPYTRRQVAAVALVEAPGLDYRYKYADRSALDALRASLPAGVEPMLVQDGLLTDGIYANLCFFDGGRWLTPDRPLLEGVARAAAIAAGEITPAKITTRDVEQGRYTKIRLINCMNLLKEANDIPL